MVGGAGVGVPAPVTNRSRRKDNGVSNYSELVGDYTNPILQPWAAEVVKKKGDLSLAGVTYPNPANECWPEPVRSFSSTWQCRCCSGRTRS